MVLQNVDSLSDEDCPASPGVRPGLPSVPPTTKSPRKRKLDVYGTAAPKVLSRILASKCGCTSKSCFKPFRTSRGLYEKWLAERQLLCKFTKLEKDAHIFSLMKAASRRRSGKTHLSYLGFSVCNKAFIRLLGIGKSRFGSLRKAVVSGQEYCPFDLRYGSKGPKIRSHTRECVHEFLTKLYLEVAEPIPDGINSNRRPRQGRYKLDRPNLDRSAIRHVPYGSISDYHRQCQLDYPAQKIGRKLFSAAPKPKPATNFCLIVLVHVRC